MVEWLPGGKSQVEGYISIVEEIFMNSILKKIITSLLATVITIACANAQLKEPLTPKSASQQQPVTLVQLMEALNDPAVLKMVQDAAKDPNSVIISSPELIKLMQDKVQLQITLEMLEAIKKITKKEEKKGWAQEKLDTLKSLGWLFLGSQAFLIAFYCTHPLWGRLVKGVSKQVIDDFAPAIDLLANHTVPAVDRVTTGMIRLTGNVIRVGVNETISVIADGKDALLNNPSLKWYTWAYFTAKVAPVVIPIIQGVTTAGTTIFLWYYGAAVKNVVQSK